MWNQTIYDCQECGACCVNPGHFGGTAYVYLTRDESKRMKRIGLSVVQDAGVAHLGTRMQPRGNGAAICVAFRGDVGATCGCSIYEDRPGKCRGFQVGEELCKAARREAGLAV
jgi:Fe-S-cluster containining protein